MDNEIIVKRGYLVVKANELVQKSRFNLSVPEQKSIAYICSMIKPAKEGEEYQLEYEFNIREFCKICGIDYASGKNYMDIKTMLQSLSDRSMWVTFPDKPDEEVLCRWLQKVRTNKKSGIAHVKIDEDLAPYLFALGQNFTRYQLVNVLAMKSAYSIRLYELMKSYEYKREITFDIDDLKKKLMVENVKSYDNFKDFRRKVLEIAEREINEYTDINMSYEPIFKGRKVVKVCFRIFPKTELEKFSVQCGVNSQLSD